MFNFYKFLGCINYNYCAYMYFYVSFLYTFHQSSLFCCVFFNFTHPQHRGKLTNPNASRRSSTHPRSRAPFSGSEMTWEVCLEQAQHQSLVEPKVLSEQNLANGMDFICLPAELRNSQNEQYEMLDDSNWETVFPFGFDTISVSKTLSLRRCFTFYHNKSL